MEYLTDRACVVEYSEGSCCGFLWCESWVITHTTFLLPSLVKNKLNVDQLEDFLENKSIKVTLPKRTQPVLAVVSCIWKAEKFSKVVSRLLLKSTAWKFNEGAKTDRQSLVDKEHEAVISLLPYFVLLRLKSEGLLLTDVQVAAQISLGQRLHITSTPFASVCPQIFFNSVVQGMVSQIVEDVFILTDAKCLPATEGSPVSTWTTTGVSLLGVVVAPLVWRHSEWLGLSVVCSFTDVLNSLVNKQNSLQKVVVAHTTLSFPEPRQQMYTTMAVVLVHTLMSWGSGVLIDPNHILTCGHVVANNKTVRVRLGVGDWKAAQVIYSSDSTGVYDLALLHVPSKTDCFLSQTAAPQQGQPAIVVGHGVFGEGYGLTAMTTAGVVSKVLCHNSMPVLLQTSCTVQNGASGGAVVTEEGQLLGIVTSNVKDQANQTCYPHLNMAVPLLTVWPTIQKYLQNKDISVLKALEVEDETVKNMWLLKAKAQNDKMQRSKL